MFLVVPSHLLTDDIWGFIQIALHEDAGVLYGTVYGRQTKEVALMRRVMRLSVVALVMAAMMLATMAMPAFA